MPILFDTLIPEEDFVPESIGVSTSGKYIISSNANGTYLETMSESRMSPILILPFPCDTIGFFGKDIDAVALASGNTLRILQLSRMAIVAKIIIRPGSLFVPKYGESPYVGVLSESGQSFLINENGGVISAGLKVGEGYNVLWSSSMVPSGYSWITDNTANVYLRSHRQDDGAVLSSTHGITMYSLHRDRNSSDEILYLSTHDEPNILKSARSAADSVIVNPVITFDKGVVIDRMVQLPDGRPLVASGHYGARVVSSPVGQESKLSQLVEGVLDDTSRFTALQCIGMSSYLSWTQTPITPPVASVTNYATEGRPRYEISTVKPSRKVITPVTNKLMTAIGMDGNSSTYRIVSKYTMGRHLAEFAAVICDDDGSVAAGQFSPSVERLYNMGVVVVIVPVDKNKTSKRIINEDLVADLDDISSDIVERRVARRLILIGDNDNAAAAVKTFSLRRSLYEGLMLIDPSDDSVNRVPSKRRDQVMVVETNNELPKIRSDFAITHVHNVEDMERAYSWIVDQ